MFSIGLVIYALVIWAHSGHDTLFDWVLEWIGAIGVGLMVASVSIFAWGFLP